MATKRKVEVQIFFADKEKPVELSWKYL